MSGGRPSSTPKAATAQSKTNAANTTARSLATSRGGGNLTERSRSDTQLRGRPGKTSTPKSARECDFGTMRAAGQLSQDFSYNKASLRNGIVKTGSAAKSQEKLTDTLKSSGVLKAMTTVAHPTPRPMESSKGQVMDRSKNKESDRRTVEKARGLKQIPGKNWMAMRTEGDMAIHPSSDDPTPSTKLGNSLRAKSMFSDGVSKETETHISRQNPSLQRSQRRSDRPPDFNGCAGSTTAFINDESVSPQKTRFNELANNSSTFRRAFNGEEIMRDIHQERMHREQHEKSFKDMCSHTMRQAATMGSTRSTLKSTIGRNESRNMAALLADCV